MPRPMRTYKAPTLTCAGCLRKIVGEVKMDRGLLYHPVCLPKALPMTASGSRIAEIAERWAKATPGPWAVGKSVHHDGHNIYASETQGDVTSPDAHLSLEDATAIAAAPADIAYLVALLTPERLATAIERAGYAAGVPGMDRHEATVHMAADILAALEAQP